jgi:two-component system response regulator TctD
MKEEAEIVMSGASAAGERIMGTCRVLIVEDQDDARRLLKSLFVEKGWEVVACATAYEALTSLDPPPNCLVLDLDLPDGRGEVILERVRASKLPTQVVAVTTGLSDGKRLARAESFHPDLLLTKPLDWDTLWNYCEAKLCRAEPRSGA